MYVSCASSTIFGFWQEEEALIAAHRKEIEDTMEIVREVSSFTAFSCSYVDLFSMFRSCVCS